MKMYYIMKWLYNNVLICWRVYIMICCYDDVWYDDGLFNDVHLMMWKWCIIIICAINMLI